ncbi:MAG TPA: glutamine-hydrolyzing GMP synthase [Acidimicrobiia bacterium]|nr:glutamine-hydrolyzing GMP synthase [Acidimicrobiia bacterium]
MTISAHVPEQIVLVVDFGAQYAQLIARRVREAHVYSEIVSRKITAQDVRAKKPAAIILSGGPKSVHEDGAPLLDQEIYDLGIPILGICYGAQLIAKQLGGEVAKTGSGEYGRTELSVLNSSLLLHDLDAQHTVWMSHFDTITKAPEGFLVSGTTSNTPAAVMENAEASIFGVQFHPEVKHTPNGQEILKRFLYEGAHCAPTWTNSTIIDDSVAAIQEQVGSSKVICALSGGVDSSVAAALMHKAVGDQLVCVYVDTGMMRHGESEQVEKTFRDQFKIDLIHVKAQDRFLEQLKGVTEPEEKRKIIGETFIRIFEEVEDDIQDAKFLVQGTLYPDVIESGNDDASTIKSHHNVGGLPEDMKFELVEPLRNLFKDEVRAIGAELGLPEDIVWRQPFPGPGLAVRIVGDITLERLEIVRAADFIVVEEIRRAGLYREIWQSFAVLPTIKSVGVQGDERTYAYPIIIRAVTSDDAMTADFARIDFDILEKIANRIINEVPGVNRVAYDVTSKPPGTIEWE